MGTTIIVMGQSGTGKSASLRNCDPQKTLLIKAMEKPLPFKSASWRLTSDGGNVIVSDDKAKIIHAMEKTRRKMIVIDDFQYTMSNEFMRRVTDQESGNGAFQKYNEIAKNAWDIFMCANRLPNDVTVYFLSHTQTDDFGHTKIKTIGKLLDEKIVIEGMVSIVLRTLKINDNYVFSTKNNGLDTVKSPMGLFEDEHIPNDLAFVDSQIRNFYELPQL